MPSPGRPPIAAEKRRGAPVPVRFTDAERALIDWAAAQSDEAVSAWVRTEAVAAAKRLHRRHQHPTTDNA